MRLKKHIFTVEECLGQKIKDIEQSYDLNFRITREDKEHYIVTMDFIASRLNF
jgi:hypothetical protein